eukprot:856877-Prymnesium_polylepis.3
MTCRSFCAALFCEWTRPATAALVWVLSRRGRTRSRHFRHARHPFPRLSNDLLAGAQSDGILRV